MRKQLYERKLSASDLGQHVAGGGTVLYRGAAIRDADNLPSAVDLAKDDPVQKQLALADLQAQRAALDAQIADAAKAQAGQAAPEGETPEGSVGVTEAETSTGNVGARQRNR